MDRQRVFNAVWEGLKAQGFERSMNDNGGCVYRGEDNRKCAIGILLPDATYNRLRDPEGCNVEELTRRGAFPEWAAPESDDCMDVEFLHDLRRSHDRGLTPDEMQARLRVVAGTYGLTVPQE